MRYESAGNEPGQGQPAPSITNRPPVRIPHRHSTVTGSGLAICADDYGLTPGIGTAIRDLLDRNRLSAASCMTVGPFWPRESRLLQGWEARADLGLHLTLTDQPLLGKIRGLNDHGHPPGPGRLLLLARNDRLDQEEIRGEIHRQIDRFEEALGFPPAFVDGHHHVHQFPMIREALLDIIRQRLGVDRVWLRYCDEPLSTMFRHAVAPARALFLNLISRTLGRLGRGLGVAGNVSFRGIRHFREKTPYPRLFARFLKSPVPMTLIMCHPGLVDEPLRRLDPVTLPREGEYRHLASEECGFQLESAGLPLVRPSQAWAY